MTNNLRLYVWTNVDGVLICPWMGDSPESQKRVFVGGGPITTMNDVQLRSLIEIAFRDPEVCKGKDAAVFYSCPSKKRGKKLLILQLNE